MSVTDADKKETYAISFYTKNAAGLIRVVFVTMHEGLIDNDDTVRVDLAEHPLYNDLQEYVRSNPRAFKKPQR